MFVITVCAVVSSTLQPPLEHNAAASAAGGGFCAPQWWRCVDCASAAEQLWRPHIM
jgi:hypothetical protein